MGLKHHLLIKVYIIQYTVYRTGDYNPTNATRKVCIRINYYHNHLSE